MVQQRVHERALGRAGRGMHHHARGLVDHDEVVILVHHVERDGLRLHVALARLGQEDFNRIALGHARLGVMTTAPPTRTAPSSISRASRVRDSAAASGASRASALSRRGGGLAPMTKQSRSCAMSESPPPVSPAMLKFLARLVTVLTATMILGLLVIVGLLVTRFRAPPDRTDAPLPDAITLPEGARATAFTQGEGWYAVVTADGRILIYDRAGGALRQVVEIGE